MTRNKKKLILVDEDGSESQLSSKVSSKLLTLANAWKFVACSNCHKLFCNTITFMNHLKQCLKDTKGVVALPTTDMHVDVLQTASEQKSSSKLLKFKCRKCKIRFPTEKLRMAHYRICLKFYCWKCKKQFSSQGTFKIHHLNKHLNQENKIPGQKHDFHCETCYKKFYECLEVISTTFPKFNKIICNDCATKPTPSAPSPSKVGVDTNSKLTVSPSELNTAEERSQDSQPVKAEQVKVNNVVKKKVRRREPTPPPDLEISSTHNALLQYESKIDSLFDLMTLKAHKKEPLCRVCNRKGRCTKHYMVQHSLQLLMSNRNFRCLLCKVGSWSSGVQGVGKHLYLSHVLCIKCRYCDELFCRTNHRAAHELSSHPESLQCRLCSEAQPSTAHKTEHMRWHAKLEPVKCEICDKTYIGRNKLQIHKRYHKQYMEEPKLCIHCGKTVKFLSVHINMAHKKKGKRLCPTCGKLLSHLHYMHHQNVLHVDPALRKDTSVRCPTCGVMAKSHKHLHHHHRIVHSKALHFSCPTCSRRFPYPFQLRKHQKLCTGPRAPQQAHPENKQRRLRRKPEHNFPCRHCLSAFVKDATRLTHELNIHGAGAGTLFTCAECGEQLKSQNQYNKHRRQHTRTQAAAIQRELEACKEQDNEARLSGNRPAGYFAPVQ